MKRKLPRVSASAVFSWDPCWREDDIRRVLDQYKDEPWSALDVLSSTTLRGVSAADRLWVVVRPELVPGAVLAQWSQDCAARAVRVHAVAALMSAADAHPDSSHRESMRSAAQRCEEEGTEGAAWAAWAAAWDAARAAWDARDAWAAWAVARDAARAAAQRCEEEGTEGAAYYAAWAARDAARDAGGAELRWQVSHLRKLLKAYEGGS